MMKRPSKRKIEHWDFDDVMRYLEKKYQFDHRDFAGRFGDEFNKDLPYQDFWHWMLENNDNIHGNCCYIGIRVDDCLKGSEPDWVKTILGYFKKEFPEDSEYMKMWVEF